jgi:hypothetical protein
MVERSLVIFGVVVAAATLALGVGVGILALRYLGEYPLTVPLVGLSMLTLSVAVLALRLPRSPGGARAAAWLTALLLLMVLPPLSTLWPGGITHARFGLTVVGAMPLPLVDPVIHADGQLGFRDKTHSLLAAELEPLRASGAERIVIGTGWSEQVRVSEVVRQASDVEVLDTPGAILRHRELREQGVRVVLLLHSTC